MHLHTNEKNGTKVWEGITAKVNSLGVCLAKSRRNGEGCSVLPKNNFLSSEPRGEKPASPKNSSKKIIDLFGDSGQSRVR